LLQPQSAHSQVSQVQNSPLQSGHSQPLQAHELAADAVAVLAAQHECPAAHASFVPVDVASVALQPQPWHSQMSQVQNSPLQSEQAQSMQPQPPELAVLRAIAVNVQARPIRPSTATMINSRFMVNSLCK
jgi:hypothetical protein